MIASSVALLLTLAAPQEPAETPVEVRGGALVGGRLFTDRLGLGARQAHTEAELEAPEGSYRTAGGIVLRAKSQGVKLDFPGGAELLVDPRGRVHRRDGEAGPENPNGLMLVLTDGALLRVAPERRRDLPLARVEVSEGESTSVLWSAFRPRRAQGGRRRPELRVPVAYAVVDGGGSIYQITAFGPLLFLERTLPLRSADQKLPSTKIVILGEPLRESLQALPARLPPTIIQYPSAPQGARQLAAASPILFPDNAEFGRPQGALGELVIPLRGDFRLDLRVREGRVPVLGLYRSVSSVPAVEWTLLGSGALHIVRPDGGAQSGTRYFLNGFSLEEQLGTVAGLPSRASDRRRVLERMQKMAWTAAGSR